MSIATSFRERFYSLWSSAGGVGVLELVQRDALLLLRDLVALYACQLLAPMSSCFCCAYSIGQHLADGPPCAPQPRGLAVGDIARLLLVLVGHYVEV